MSVILALKASGLKLQRQYNGIVLVHGQFAAVITVAIISFDPIRGYSILNIPLQNAALDGNLSRLLVGAITELKKGLCQD